MQNFILFSLLRCWCEHCKAFRALARVWETCKTTHGGLLTLQCLQVFKAIDKLDSFQHVTLLVSERTEQDVSTLASVASDMLSLRGAESGSGASRSPRAAPGAVDCLLWQEGWTGWPTEIPSNPYHSVILWLMSSDDLKRALDFFWKGACSSQSRSCFFVRLCFLAEKQMMLCRGLQGDHWSHSAFSILPRKTKSKSYTSVLLHDSRPMPLSPPRSALRTVFLVASQLLQP